MRGAFLPHRRVSSESQPRSPGSPELQFRARRVDGTIFLHFWAEGGQAEDAEASRTDLLHLKGVAFFFFTRTTVCPTSFAVVSISGTIIILQNPEPFLSQAIHKYAPVNLYEQMKQLICCHDGAGVEICLLNAWVCVMNTCVLVCVCVSMVSYIEETVSLC